MGVFEERKSLRRLFGEFLREETVSSFFFQSKSSTTQKVNCQYRTILPIKPASIFYESQVEGMAECYRSSGDSVGDVRELRKVQNIGKVLYERTLKHNPPLGREFVWGWSRGGWGVGNWGCCVWPPWTG